MRKEAHKRRGGRWLGESNDGFSSMSGVVAVEANDEESRGEAGAEGEERESSLAGSSSYSRTRRWPRAAKTVGRNGSEAVGGQGGGHGRHVGAVVRTV
jgi:hypothetical protein